MITQVSPLATVVLNGAGDGQVAIGPPSGTKWTLNLATLAVSTSTKQPQGFLYRGGASGPLELVDSTYTGAQASSGKVGGLPYFSGQRLWAVWKGGDAGATATLQAYGQQGSRSDPFDASPPGEGFANPVVAGTALIIPAINSPNYITGVQGWSINQDGTAEFSSGVFRGAVLIGGPPATGAVSIGLTGTAIPAVLRNFNADYTSWYEADLRWITATDFFFVALVHNTPLAVTETIAGIYTVVGGVQLQQLVESTGSTVNWGSATYNTVPLAMGFRSVNTTIDAGSSIITAAPLAAADPVAGLPTAETWHAATLANGWTNAGGGNPNMQYRLVASPPNCVQLHGRIVPGTKANGTSIFALPVGYRPATQAILPVTADNTVADPIAAHIVIQTGGSVTIGACSTVNTFLAIQCLFPLDA